VTNIAQQEREIALDEASQKISDARAECMRELPVKPKDIAKIMMDEAVLGLIANGLKLSEIQTIFRKYERRDLVRMYTAIRNAADRSLH
jgi:hypothetical protein